MRKTDHVVTKDSMILQKLLIWIIDTGSMPFEQMTLDQTDYSAN
jgi:hypothetical protein